MPQPPSVDRFPASPACWYLFGHLSELRRGPVSKDLLGSRLVAFQTESGKVAVIDARCAHLGADLGCGQVVGETIRCPFHHWRYDAAGLCTHLPSQTTIPEFARQRAYPVVVRHGLVFFFNGPEPLFPLPFFFEQDPTEFVPGRPFRFTGDCSWYMIAANGFDGQHFQAVHDRRLTRPPEVDCPTPFARRMRFHAEVSGDSWRDKILRQFVGRTVDVSITSYGGPFILVTAELGRANSYILISTRPIAAHEVLVEVIVFARRLRPTWLRPFLEPVSLGLRRWFTRGFMQGDIDRLAGIRYNPSGLVDSDRHLLEFFDWLAELPQSATPKPATNSTGRLSNMRKDTIQESFCAVQAEADRRTP